MGWEHNRELVAAVIRDALRDKFRENADPYEDDPFHFGVAFLDGSFVDVSVAPSPPISQER